MLSNHNKSYCVLRLTALGDCINAFGVISAMKQQKPDSDIVWIIDKRFSSLFIKPDGTSLVKIIDIDFKKHGLLKNALLIKNILRHQKFDYLLNLQTSIKASIVSIFIKARHRLGYDKERSRECQSLFINQKVVSPNNPHVLAGFLAFAKAAGFKDITPSWEFELTEDEIQDINLLIDNKAGEKILTIAPASAKQSKNWTVEGYSHIAKLAFDYGFKVVLSGGNASIEKDLCESINNNLDHRCINLCGKTTLRGLTALLSVSSIVLSPDSAALHLASALHTPVIGLFAVHNPKRVGSWNFPDLWVSVYSKLAKKELGKKHIPWRYRVKDPDAMKNISIEDVESCFIKALQKYNLLDDD